MTCIVGILEKKTVWIGSDSLGSSENCQIPRIDGKIFRVDGNMKALIGFTGSFRAGQVLQYSKNLIDSKAACNHKYMVTKFIPKVIDIFDKGGFIKQDEDGSKAGDPFLVAFKNKLFQVDSDFQVAESLYGYDAVGSGYAYALGSLSSTENLGLNAIERIHLALQAASKFGVGIGAPFHIFNTSNDKEIFFES